MAFGDVAGDTLRARLSQRCFVRSEIISPERVCGAFVTAGSQLRGFISILLLYYLNRYLG